jgi:hypothetical protein
MNIARIIMAGSLAVTLATFASAQVNNPGSPYDIYVSGSTAYRTQVVNAEITVASAGLTVANGFAAGTQPGEGYTNAGVFALATLQGAGVSVIHGVDANNNEIIIHNHWTGSTAGLTDLSNNNVTVTYITDAATPAINNTATGLAAGATTAPEISMSDCVYTDVATVLASTGDNAAGKAAGLVVGAANPVDAGVVAGPHGWVGSVDFEWVLGSISGPATVGAFSNITQDNAEVLLTNGSIGANFITGNAGDAGSVAILIGRNEDSGTRVLTQAESWAYGTSNKFGLGAGTNQYLVTQNGVALPQNSGYSSLSGVAGGITAIQKWPRYNWNGANYTTAAAGGWNLYTETAPFPGITWATLGHSGYNGGGDVAAILESPNPVLATAVAGVPAPFTQVYIVTCIGTHDAAGALTNAVGPNATALSYNGVPYTLANIENGSYALWNFEHCYYLNGGQPNAMNTIANGAAIKADADALADALYNGTFGVNPTDVGIAGNLVNGFPAMTGRSTTAGSYQ